MRKLTCEICGAEFIPGGGHAKYCSKECRTIAAKEQNRGVREKRKALESAAKSSRALTDITSKASELGMSYGQYVGMVLHGR